MACWWTTGDPAPALDGTFLELSDTLRHPDGRGRHLRHRGRGRDQPGGRDVPKISGTCAIRADSTLACWDGAGPRPTASLAYAEPWRLSRQVRLPGPDGRQSHRFRPTTCDIDERVWDGRFGAWTPSVDGEPATTATVTTRRGTPYCFAVRLETRAARVSPWTGRDEGDLDTGCSASPFDDRLLTRSDGWRALEHEKFYGRPPCAPLPGARG